MLQQCSNSSTGEKRLGLHYKAKRLQVHPENRNFAGVFAMALHEFFPISVPVAKVRLVRTKGEVSIRITV